MKIIQKLMSPVGLALYRALDRHDAWEVTQYRIVHRDISCWTANTWLSFHINDDHNALSMIDRLLCMRKAKEVRRRAKAKLKGGEYELIVRKLNSIWLGE